MMEIKTEIFLDLVKYYCGGRKSTPYSTNISDIATKGGILVYSIENNLKWN